MADLFLSHSSKDKPLARKIATDLQQYDIQVWFEESRILVGDSISQKIARGLDEVEFVAVLLTRNSGESGWVEKEWQAKIGEEAKEGKIVILPLRADDCVIPMLLRDKKYADFHNNYELALTELVTAIQGHANRQEIRSTEYSYITNNNFNKNHDESYLDVSLFDDIIREKSLGLYHRLLDIRRYIIPILRTIPITEFSHDSESHARQVLIFVTELYYNGISSSFSGNELFVLAVFCLVHDIGMLPRGNFSPKRLYQTHNVYSRDFVNHLHQKKLLTVQEIKEIGSLCLMHKESLSRAKIHFDSIESSLRLSLIFSIFKVADMLDVETQPGEILRINPELLHQTIASIDINPELQQIKVWKAVDVIDSVFQSWLNFFLEKITEFNVETKNISYEYSVVSS